MLVEMGDDYDIEEKSVANDAGNMSWYGVIDDGNNEPEIILLSGHGDWERTNMHKNAQEILNILAKD